MIDLAGLTIEHALGTGGQGSVFLALAPSGTRLAVKLVEVSSDVDRALFERRLKSVLSDAPNAAVWPVLSHGETRGAPAVFRRQFPRATPRSYFMVMHFVEGLPLHELTALRMVDIAAVLATVARRLARLPSGVVHGDLRAPNIFVLPNGDLVIIDPDLFREPAPEEDLRALGALGHELLTKAEPGSELATGKLSRLLDELGGNAPPDLQESGRRFAEIAMSLGAPADDLTSVLAGRASTVPRAGVESRGGAAKPAKRAVSWKLVLGATAVAGIAAGFVFTRPTAPRLLPQPAAPLSEGGLYDSTGTVDYHGQVHELADGEHLQMHHGFVGFDMKEPVPRVAILNRDGKVLWERLKPPEGYIHVDVPPEAFYVVEIDRQRPGGGVQHDRSGGDVINEDNPQRYTVRNLTMSAPP